MNKNERLYLLGEVADRLKVRPHRITYLFLTRTLAEPNMRMGNRRMFTESDIKRISVALNIQPNMAGKETHG